MNVAVQIKGVNKNVCNLLGWMDGWLDGCCNWISTLPEPEATDQHDATTTMFHLQCGVSGKLK